jgi:hypothetical protein
MTHRVSCGLSLTRWRTVNFRKSRVLSTKLSRDIEEPNWHDIYSATSLLSFPSVFQAKRSSSSLLPGYEHLGLQWYSRCIQATSLPFSWSVVNERKGRLFITEQVRHEYCVAGKKELPSYVTFLPSDIPDELKKICASHILIQLFVEGARKKVSLSSCLIALTL